MNIPLEPIPKEDKVSSLTFLLTTQLAEGGRPNFLIHVRYFKYIYFVGKVLIRHFKELPH